MMVIIRSGDGYTGKFVRARTALGGVTRFAACAPEYSLQVVDSKWSSALTSASGFEAIAGKRLLVHAGAFNLGI